jgi:hypothetical protein
MERYVEEGEGECDGGEHTEERGEEAEGEVVAEEVEADG